MNYSILTDLLNFITAILDIAIVTVLVYMLLRILIQSERLITLLNVFFGYLVLYFIATFLDLNTLYTILNSISSWIILIIFILFQNEIRDAVEHLGMSGRIFKTKQNESDSFFDELIDATFSMANNRTGAIITLERSMSLNQYTKNAIELDATFSKQLIETIFNKETVIHDGAVIIRDERVMYASTYYPISLDLTIGKEFGTRHRAALTISGETDAITIVVSEETGNVSLTYRGKHYYDVTKQFMKQFLIEKEV